MSEEKKGLFERMFKGGKAKGESNKGQLEEQLKKRLNSIVYDDELVTELLPVFTKLHATEGFSQVWELLEAKEQQIEAISGGDWFKQETNQDEQNKEKQEQQSDATDLVDEILKQQYTKE